MSASQLTILALLLVHLIGYVLPVERIVAELARAREKAPPLRLETTLVGIVPGWPQRVTLELHPDFGQRVRDDQGRQWLLYRGELVSARPSRPPVWIPELEFMTLRSEEDLRTWLERARVDLERTEFARCGESDCYILGGKNGSAQVWLEKERFELLRLVLPGGRELVFEDYRSWSGVRFPREIKVLDAHGELAILTVETLRRARELAQEDFVPTLEE